MPKIELQTDIDDSKLIYVEPELYDEVAERLVKEYLKHDSYLELNSEFASSYADLARMDDLYKTDNEEWLNKTIDRAKFHWDDKITDIVLRERD